MEKGIEDFLSEEPLPVEPVAEVTEPEVVAEAEPETVERPRGPDGKFIKKEETGVENAAEPEAVAEPVPPTEPTNQLPPAEYAALKDERRKRQQLEDELRQMRENIARMQAQPQAPQPQVDFWDDPQTYMQAQFSQFGEQLLQQFEQRRQAERIDASEAAARARYADYDQAFQAFSQAVQANPRLAAEMAQANDPAEYAYAKGKTALTLETVGSMEQLEAQLRAKWEAEVRAVAPTPRVTLPSTTATDGSVASRGAPQWAGPTPVDDILRS